MGCGATIRLEPADQSKEVNPVGSLRAATWTLSSCFVCKAWRGARDLAAAAAAPAKRAGYTRCMIMLRVYPARLAGAGAAEAAAAAAVHAAAAAEAAAEQRQPPDLVRVSLAASFWASLF